MDELLLIEAIERYANGNMQGEELMHFENARKANSEMDQFVVNHLAFLQQVDKVSDRKHLLTSIDAVRADLISNHEINIEQKEDAKVISFWDRNRKKLAVAASVAAIFTVCSLGLIFAYNKSKNDIVYTELKNKVNRIEEGMKNKQDKNSANKKESYVQAQSNGTGFLVNEAGYLVTNYHVIKGAKQVYAYNETFGDLTAEVAVIDESNDLAILKIKDSTFKVKSEIPYVLKNEDFSLGQNVFTMGYSRPPYVTYNQGHISSKASSISLAKSNNFLLTLQVDGGNSGSPIFNNNGHLVGIVSAKENQENGFTLGIKTTGLESIFKTLKEQKLANVRLANNELVGNSISNQTKKIEPFVFMVKVK